MNNKTDIYFWIGFWGLCLFLIYKYTVMKGWTCGLGVFIEFFGLYLIGLIYDSTMFNRYTHLRSILDRVGVSPLLIAWFLGWIYFQKEVLHLCQWMIEGCCSILAFPVNFLHIQLLSKTISLSNVLDERP